MEIVSLGRNKYKKERLQEQRLEAWMEAVIRRRIAKSETEGLGRKKYKDEKLPGR